MTDRQEEVIDHLKAKCYRLKIANDTLLKVIKDLTEMLYEKWSKDDGSD